MEPELFSPGLRRIGAFTGAASLAAPNPVLIHNTGRSFPTQELRETYAALKAKDYRQESERMSDEAVVDWVANLKDR